MAQTVLYFDLDDVRTEDLHRGRARAGVDAVTVVRKDVAWPDDAGAPIERLPDARDPTFLAPFMRRIDALGDTLASLDAWTRRGVSLFEVARYRYFFAAAPAEHRRWALAELIRRCSPARIVWVSRPIGWSDRQELARLRRAAGRAGVDLVLASGWPTRVEAKAHAREALYQLARPALDRFAGAKVLLGPVAAPSPTRAPHVVFLEYFANNVRVAIPIAERLVASGATVTWFAGRPAVAAALAGRGIASVAVEPRVHAAMARNVVGWAGRVLARALATGTRDHAPDLDAHVLARTLVPAGEEAAAWVQALDELLTPLAPAAVLSTTHSSIPGRAAALVARQLGARAVFIQHGSFPARQEFAHFCNDLKLVWGTFEKELFDGFGHPAASTVATGSTLYDDFFRRARELPAGDVGGGSPRRLCFMASRTGGMVSGVDVSRRTLRAVIEAARAVDRVRLTVKLHPADHTGVLEEELRSHPEIELVRAGSSQDLILASDVVIVVSSTTGYEACVADRPLVCFNLTGNDDSAEYVRFGAALSIVRSEDLISAVRRAFEDEPLRAALRAGRERFIAHMLHGGPGAAERAAHEILVASGFPASARGAREGVS